MNTTDIKEQLIHHHQVFTTYIDELSEAEYLATPNDKWSAGQQIEHIYISVHPVAKLVANKGVMKEKFGTLDRPSRSYDRLVADYLEVLDGGAKAGPRFTPDVTPFSAKTTLITGITNDMKSINSELDQYTEEELEQLVIPHPVMGPFTLREMLMFTIYHVQHHDQKIKENLTA
ncbi:MAG: DinB family protein [Cytophagales bacterium]|nr:DinB family protein [Cytophagales bacterium]